MSAQGKTAGSRLTMEKCDENNDGHIWSFYLSGQISSPGYAGMCVTASGNNKSAAGSNLQLQPCRDPSGNDEASQEWFQMSVAPDSAMVFAVPNQGRACPSTFKPVVQ